MNLNENYIPIQYQKLDISELCNQQTKYFYNKLKNDEKLINKISLDELNNNNFILNFLRHENCKLDLYGLHISFNPLLYINQYSIPSVIEVFPVGTNENFIYENPVFFNNYGAFIEKILSISDNMLFEL